MAADRIAIIVRNRAQPIVRIARNSAATGVDGGVQHRQLILRER